MRMAQNRGPMLTSPTRFGRTNSTPPQQFAGKPPVNWTPFNLPRSQIFMQIKNKMDLRRPGLMKTAVANRDHTRYCDFHQDHGHTTEQCNSLKSKLESLAQKGMLNEYVQRAEQPRFIKEQRPQPQGVRNPPNRQGVGYQQTPPPLPPPARIIHMITGGLEAGGLSSKQRKLYIREVKHQNRAQKRKIDDAEWKNQPITFTSADLDTVVTPHNDQLVTSVMINNCEVQRVLVDTGSAPDIMYFHCFESLGLDPALLQKYDGPIYGFNNQPVPVEGVLTLHVAFGSGRTYVTPSVRFLVVKMVSSFNIIIGRPTLTEIRAVVSQSHLCIKFPTPMGIATLRGNQEVARHCYITSVTQPMKGKAQTPEAIPQRISDNQQVMGVEIVDNRPEDENRAAPVEDVEEVLIDDRDPNRKMQIGTRLNPEKRAELIAFLQANNDFTSVYHPESNGMVESVNKCILEGIRPRLEQHKAKWADELNNVLWAYKTTSRTATGETPYHLAFGTEAVILVEIGVPSFRVTHFNEGRNGQLLRENLDLLAEVREEARLRTLTYKQKLANFYNKRVRPRTFKVGDLVLRKAGLTGFKTRFGKLALNWEGPYAVAEVPHPGAYVLQDAEGKRVPRVWNVNNLKKFYP
ncbi:hypothetical protein SLEP1_g42446 [Rubroshorea leprosula]|uniref:Integrase catalytic domain-containing protein n=1 Tax=Rubroshorea leprosula TaxID=152421 RepID=A0AAV5LA94_9ROSI|nr:hypothetical protein SLEP1_g42446 [Rubroshorea leprosula]